MKKYLGTRVPLTLATAAVVALPGVFTMSPVGASPVAASASSASSSSSAAAAPPPHVRLTRDPDSPRSVVRSATVPAFDTATVRRTPRGARVGPRTSTSVFRMVGVTWRGDGDPNLSVRVRREGRWSRWSPLETMHHGPTGKEPRATTLKWVGGANGVQVRNTGPAPTGLQLVLINPGRKASDARVRPRAALGPNTHTATSSSRAARAARAPMPVLFTRRQWGADNSWRNGRPRYNKRLMQVHVHHTVNSNRYSRADVPAMLRGMYRYHTKSLGWFDIGYNFLVDKFGRIWVGRSGGPRQLVRGAHTLGFNHNSVGVAAIGNHQSATPPSRKLIRSIVRLSAWKLDKRNKRATGTVRVRSEGSDRFRAGRYVRLPVIDGHRDTNYTSCPGWRLYRELRIIRRRAQARINYFD